jgi:hypothetical protein
MRARVVKLCPRHASYAVEKQHRSHHGASCSICAPEEAYEQAQEEIEELRHALTVLYEAGRADRVATLPELICALEAMGVDVPKVLLGVSP